MWQQPWFVTLIKQVFAGIAVLIVLFMVVRPAMKTLQGRAVGSKRKGVNNELESDTLSLSGGQALGLPAGGKHVPNYVEQLALAKQLASQDPRQVAKVVKTWVAGN